MDTEQAQHQPIGLLVDPGPIDSSVLTLQNQHRSSSIWNVEDLPVIACHRADASLHEGGVMLALDNRVMDYLVSSGFYGIHKIGIIKYDWALITALVECWREERHRFHLPNGKATIILLDVGALTGLPLERVVVTSFDPSQSLHQCADLCEELLGVRPPENQIKGGLLKIKWLMSHFDNLPIDASEEMICFHARAYILALIGGTVMPDCSGNKVKLMFLPLLRQMDMIGGYSWGSEALACLYRELCRTTRPHTNSISGFLTLLQIWAWKRLLCLRPEMGHRVSSKENQILPPGPRGCRWSFAMLLEDVPTHILRVYQDQLDHLSNDQLVW